MGTCETGEFLGDAAWADCSVWTFAPGSVLSFLLPCPHEWDHCLLLMMPAGAAMGAVLAPLPEWGWGSPRQALGWGMWFDSCLMKKTFWFLEVEQMCSL